MFGEGPASAEALPVAHHGKVSRYLR